MSADDFTEAEAALARDEAEALTLADEEAAEIEAALARDEREVNDG